MFKEKFIRLCNERKIAPTAVCKEVGLSNAAYTGWNEDSVPRQATLLKIADYFGVTVDCLLGKEDEKTTTITDYSEPFLFEKRFWNHHSD